MKLVEFRVQMFKGVIDSGVIGVEHLTTLVGKNESGKTTLLKALHKLNPAKPDPYVIDREWPRGKRASRSNDQVVCTARFALDDAEQTEFLALTDQAGSLTDVEVQRDYGGRLEVRFPSGLFPDRLHPNQVDKLCESLPDVTDGVSLEFRKVVEVCHVEARRVAHEGRFGDFETLHARQVTWIQHRYSASGQSERTLEEQYLTQYIEWLRQLPTAIETVPSIQRRAHEAVIEKLPTFIYMDDFRIFEGKAQLDEVKQRRDAKKLGPGDSTFLMILYLAGLDLDQLVAQGTTEDREQRQYDIQDGAETLTNLFKDRLKQREYAIQFRVDGQEFYTLVTDGHNGGLIRLEERSKGFQWFFSFDLLFMHETKGSFEGCVLLLDEPGLHLHPGAQKDLLVRLDEYANGNTLIYSTHLPFMLDLKHPERLRVINEGPMGAFVSNDLTQSQPEAKLTLQSALGMSASQSYLVAQRNIVVEGFDDNILISALSELLIRSEESGLPEDVLITHAGGASEAAYMATFMMGQRLDVVVLLDSDTAGDMARDKVVKAWLHRYEGKDNQVFKLGDVLGVGEREFAIEDLFDDDFYLARVKAVCAKQLTLAGSPSLALVGKDQLCKRVERALQQHGITLNKGSVAKRIRSDISRMKDVSELSKTTADYARQVIAALTKALPELSTSSK